MSSKKYTERTSGKNWFRKKNKKKENLIHPKLDKSFISELVGDKRILDRNKPQAWFSSPLIGMDKIRATTDVGRYYVDFASTSTIHGLNHTTAPRRHPFERFLTGIFIGAALTGLILLSFDFWVRFQNDATIFVLDNDYRSFTISKPAILLCPLEKIDVSKFADVFDRYQINDTEEARQFFTFIANATYEEFLTTPLYKDVQPDKWLSILWELKSDVKTQNEDESIGTWIVTEEGFCLIYYSYVGVFGSYEYWMGNHSTILVPSEHEVASYSYLQRGEAVLSMKVVTHGVKMSSHSSLEFPDIDKVGIKVDLKQIGLIELIPQEVSSSEAVEKLSMHQRECTNLGEGQLKLWPIYTYRMCVLECKYELIRELCNCYPHFVRPTPGIPICTATQLRCLGQHSQELMKVASTAGKKCGCLRTCHSASYQDNEESMSYLKPGSPTAAIINIHIEFPMGLVRQELQFGFTDFLASVGGAAGLFLGASVISFIEIIYHATLRLFWYILDIQKKKEAKLNIHRGVSTMKK